MTVPEASRHDLYTGLVEVLGEARAGTLMAYLPSYDPSTVATAADIASLRSQVDRRFDVVDRRFDAVDRRFDAVDRRFDRLFLTLVAGLFVIVAAMAGVVVAGLG